MIRISFGNSATEIVRPLHGLNCGPRSSTVFSNTSDSFQKAGIPYARLAEIDPPYGSGEYIDISCIFKDPNADPDAEASYDFQQTDLVLRTTVEIGTQIIYRLGVSEEPGILPAYIHPPKDCSVWASVCEHIIRHYNEGWANGYRFGIRYWEIWNEPEALKNGRATQWTETEEEFFRLYCVAAKHLKKCFGDSVQIGGYSAGSFYRDEEIDRRKIDFAKSFLKTVKKESAPLDFFSWHFFSASLDHFRQNARLVHELLQTNGFDKTESILASWEMQPTDRFTELPQETVAAFDVGVMIAAQQNGVSIATHRDGLPGHPCCRIFDRYSRKPNKSFSAFEVWQALYRLRSCGEVDLTEQETVSVLSAQNGKEAAVLISGYGSEEKKIHLDIQNFCGENGVEVKTYVIDSESQGCDARMMEKIPKDHKLSLDRNINDSTVLLLKLQRVD